MNLPNKITIVRILLIPMMVIAFYFDKIISNFIYAGLIAALIFLIAALTDFLDGHIARKYNLVTTIGKFLDPIADKVLVITALFLTVESGLIVAPYGAIFASIIVARELVISGYRQIAASKGVIISADKTGKIKAVFQDIAMVMFLLLKTFNVLLDGILNGTLLQIYMIIAYVCLVIAVILTIWSGLEYMIKNKEIF